MCALPISSKLPERKRSFGAVVRAGQHFFPWRIAVGFAGLVLGACVVRPRGLFGQFQTLGVFLSLGFVSLGLGLRAWAAASAGDHTRSDYIEAPQLVTGGPYASVRNPIYLGSFLLGLGMVGLLDDPWLLIPHLLVFGVFFGMIVPAEEQFLAEHFGAEYKRYRQAVPKFVPALRRWPGRTERPLTWSFARGEVWIGFFLVVIYGVFRWLLSINHYYCV